MVQATLSRAMMMSAFCPKCALPYAVASIKEENQITASNTSAYKLTIIENWILH